MKIRKLLLLTLVASLFFNCGRILRRGTDYELKKEQCLVQDATNKATNCLTENMSKDFMGPIPYRTKVDSANVNVSDLKLSIYFSKHLSYQPFRNENVTQIYKLFRKYLGRKFKKYDMTLYSLDNPIESLIPNYFRSDSSEYDRNRMPIVQRPNNIPVVQCLNKLDWKPSHGLYNKNIALWHSHGFYYSRDKDRWEWQRPRLFSTVEDLLPMSFVIPYLVPMLENAGANVFLPRERDLQTNEIIIDNNNLSDSTLAGVYRELDNESWETGNGLGFAVGTPPYPANLNPFLQGSYRQCQSDSIPTTLVEWIPNIPETGEYGVYISYFASSENSPDAHYTVYHAGGKTDYIINQQIGGSTWIHLGKFKFNKGYFPQTAKVVLNNQSSVPGKMVTADAVRLGGGLGNIVRGDRVSGYPRFAECARYYLQYAGMPDTLVYHLNNDTTDYNDDYQSRAEFVNYLKGNPFGPNKNRTVPGLGIPIDLSLAFHTDAGISATDSTIGTLMIYSNTDADTLPFFPDSMSRLANRDLADIVQTQIVNDVQLKYRPDWQRRALMDARYSEAFRPNVPGCLLELLSHQNFTDMKYALAPQFRFDVSRAIYKGFLKFIATQYQYDYAIQPLPVSHIFSLFSDSAEVTLRWESVSDPLEPSAVPEKYVIYTQIENNGFGNGVLVDTNQYVMKNLEPGVIYSYQITAVNAGGESFPSEILSVCWMDTNLSPILIVNGFDRISPPEYIHEPNFKGVADFLDLGVPDRFDLNYTGSQFDFTPAVKYRTNDAPGHGNSHANYETKVINGNTFNYPLIHGTSIRNCGYSFTSCSDEAIMDNDIDVNLYKIIDIILGEEKTIHFPQMNDNFSPFMKINAHYQTFPEKLQTKIKEFCDTGGSLFISGAYVGSDLVSRNEASRADSLFAKNVLKIFWQTDHAAVNGDVCCTDSLFLPRFSQFSFNTELGAKIYAVESPDAIDPEGDARTILRYAENQFSAATAYNGNYSLVVFGFPFETIISQQSRDSVMWAVLKRLQNIQ